jgi:hypothetical protein
MCTLLSLSSLSVSQLNIFSNEFKIPEIIYDPTLVLSPHTFLLGMLFKVQAFKSTSIVSPEKLSLPPPTELFEVPKRMPL